MIKRMWRAFWRPATTLSLGVIFITGGIGGIVFWGGFNTFMEYTNTLGFCTGCHEMNDNVFQEYQKTVHWKNASGVRVVCADCHVPRDWTPKLVRKIKASNELFHHFMGTVSTPEKFNAKRMQLAQNVWAEMKANDSRECRNCHTFEAMDFEQQRRRPQKKHPEAMEEGKTCIDCHKGIAHQLPEGYTEE